MAILKFKKFLSYQLSAINYQLKLVRGFTLIEILVVIIILGIVSAIAIPGYKGMMRTTKFRQYSTNMEFLVKYSKIAAMERTKNIGVCVNDSQNLIVYDIGTSRSALICSGTEINRMTINGGDATTYGYSLSGSGGSIDPRGIAIWTGNVCITDGSQFLKTTISKTGMRTDTGTGGCS